MNPRSSTTQPAKPANKPKLKSGLPGTPEEQRRDLPQLLDAGSKAGGVTACLAERVRSNLAVCLHVCSESWRYPRLRYGFRHEWDLLQ